MTRLLKEESGYSLVEVIVSIFILAAAIIPMVGMFDMGLKSASTGGNYDGARALANASLEKVRAVPYQNAKTTYEPVNAEITPSNPVAGAPVPCDEGIYDCEVTTTYVNNNLSPNSASTTKMRVVVTVQWPDGLSYMTTGLIAQ